MDISFIIPIYNTAEEKLKRCFDSINKIKNLEYEVLLVDDGSDSFVGEFCLKYVNNHSKFHYYYQNNAGVSAARNFGIDMASGRYIAFVDSDDYILPEAYSKVLILEEFDMMVFDIEYDMGEGKSRYSTVISNKESGVYNGKVLLEELIKSSTVKGPWAKIYRKKLLIDKKIKFDLEMQNAEDADFIIQILLVIKSFVYKKEASYRYAFSQSTTLERIRRNPQKAIRSAKLEYIKKDIVIKKFRMENDLCKNYLNYITKRVIKVLIRIAGELEMNNGLDDDLKKQIWDILKRMDRKGLSFGDDVRYRMLADGHWKMIRIYHRMWYIWVGFKYKYLGKFW